MNTNLPDRHFYAIYSLLWFGWIRKFFNDRKDFHWRNSNRHKRFEAIFDKPILRWKGKVLLTQISTVWSMREIFRPTLFKPNI